MKYIIAFLLTFNLYSQEEVPLEYWIDDSNFENKINEKEAFGSNLEQIVVVEFWAKFNEANCFGDWDKIEDAIYYAWNFITKELSISPDKLYVTIYHDDEQAYVAWKGMQAWRLLQLIHAPFYQQVHDS